MLAAVPFSVPGVPSIIADVLPGRSPETSWMRMLCPLEPGNVAVIVGLVPASPAGTSRAYSQVEQPLGLIDDPSCVQLLFAPSLTLVGASFQLLDTQTTILLPDETFAVVNVAVTVEAKLTPDLDWTTFQVTAHHARPRGCSGQASLTLPGCRASLSWLPRPSGCRW